LQLLEKDPRSRPVDAHRVEQDLVGLARSVGAKVPLEPEADPESSSRPPAPTRPAIALEPWDRRIDVFEQMLLRAYGSRPPDDQERTLAELRKQVREIDGIRAASAKEQRILENIDARGREGRQRLGFAVDALGLDASKAKDEARSARAEVDRIGRDVEAAAMAYGDAHVEVVTWEGRSAQREPYRQLAQAHRACAERVDAWLAARQRERDAQSAIENKERTVGDLEYQIAELRSALASHEQEIDRDRAAAQARLVDLTGRAERVERQILQLAAQFCEPLRARADLGSLFQSLEPSASPW
jgi:serine/threonine-protein kinase